MLREVGDELPFLGGRDVGSLGGVGEEQLQDRLADALFPGTVLLKDLRRDSLPSRTMPSRRCSVPMVSWPSSCEVRSESSSTFLAGGVNGR